MIANQSLKPLICKTIAGDREAFEQLLLLYKRSIVSEIGKATNCAEDIEDISQEVALQIFRNIGSLKYPEAFSSWCRKLTERACLRHLTGHCSNCSHENLTEDSNQIAETKPICIPYAYSEQMELRGEIISALAQLSESCKEMVLLHYAYGMRYREIAEQFGVKTGTVSAAIYRSRKLLQKVLPTPRDAALQYYLDE